MANPKNFTKKYHIPIIPVIYRRCLSNWFFSSSSVLSDSTDNCLISLLFIWYLILGGTGADCPLRGPESCSCHVCVSLLPDKPLCLTATSIGSTLPLFMNRMQKKPNRLLFLSSVFQGCTVWHLRADRLIAKKLWKCCLHPVLQGKYLISRKWAADISMQFLSSLNIKCKSEIFRVKWSKLEVEVDIYPWR